MSLLDKITQLFRPAPPAERNTVKAALGEEMALSHTLTVDKLHSILRLAESGECKDLFALYRDIRLGSAHVQTITNQRQLAVLTKTLNIAPEDAKNADDVRAAQACRALTRSKGWQGVAMAHLLKGHLYPLAVLEQCYKPAPVNAEGLRYIPDEWAAVPYRLLDFTTGDLMLWDADPTRGHRLGTKRAPEPLRHVIHRGHLLTDIPDNWGGPMRAALFWWLFATMDRDWWVRFLDRFGAPFIVGRYDSSDDKSKATLSRAFSAATRLFGLVVSKETDIAVHAVATSSHGEAFEKLQVFANGELSKLFLGQSMTVTAQAGGLGGAQAEVQSNTLGDIEAWDLSALAATVNSEIIAPFLAMNGLSGSAVLQVATDTGKELASKTAFLIAATQAGLFPTDAAIQMLSDASGIPLQRSSSPQATQGAPAADVQAQAMNGAQVSSLIEVAQAVASKTLSSGVALEVLRNAFPSIPEASDRRMIAESGPTGFNAAQPETKSALILRHSGQPTNDELDGIAALGAPTLAAAFTGRFSGVPAMIAASTSAEDLEHRLATHFSTLPPSRISSLLEDALTAYAATGSASTRPFSPSPIFQK